MQKFISPVRLSLFALILSVGLISCKKEEDPATSNNETGSFVDNAMADAAFNDVASISDEAVFGSLDSYKGAGIEKVLTSCATVTIDTLVNPHLITVDFGPTDCLCKDGNYRRGQILISYTGNYTAPGSTRTITFANYFVNYNQLTGTKTVVSNGLNANGNPEFQITVNGSVIWDAQYGGGTSTYTSSRIREWVAGTGTLGWLDDVYLISGSSSGTTRTGNSYTLTTTEALRKEIGFRHFTDGTLEFTPQGQTTRVVDYGYQNGARDNLAQVTIGGIVFTIQLL